MLGEADITAMLTDLAAAGATVEVVFSPTSAPGSQLETRQIVELLERSALGASSPVILQVYGGRIRFMLVAGAAVAGIDPTLDVKVIHCATVDGEYEDVTGGAFEQITDIAGMEALEFDITDLELFVKFVWTIGGDDDPAFPFALALQATLNISGTIYTVNGLRDRDAIEFFGGEGTGVQATDDAVHVQASALPGLEVGSAITIDGTSFTVHAIQPYSDGAMIRILPRTP